MRELLVAVFDYLGRNAGRLNGLGLPPEACKALYREACDFWIESSSTAPSFEMPDRLLARFPDEVRELLRPGREPQGEEMRRA